MLNMPWVYILKSENGLYYIGSSTNLADRVLHHKGGHTPSTSKMGKLELAFDQEYKTLLEARNIEKRLKKLKRRDYIEKIIRDGFISMKE